MAEVFPPLPEPHREPGGNEWPARLGHASVGYGGDEGSDTRRRSWSEDDDVTCAGRQADDGPGELERAAADLEALADAHDECIGALEDAEGLVDVVLDDPRLRIAVVDARLRIRALSQGMADLLGVGPAAVGSASSPLTPAGWPGLRDLLPEASEDVWQDGGDRRRARHGRGAPCDR